MLNLVKAEWAKAFAGRALFYTAGVGIGLSILTTFGYVQEGVKNNADAASITGAVVRTWMALYLFAAIATAIVVTREFTTRTMSRTVLLSGTRGRVFVAKAIVSALLGVVFGLIAVAFGTAMCWVAMPAFDLQPQWDREVTLTAIGVFACSVIASLWGAFLGWIVRNQVASVLTLLVLTLLIEPAIQRIVPDVSAYLFTIALSSLYRDGKPELLSAPLATVVALAWVLVAGLVAGRTLRTRDIT